MLTKIVVDSENPFYVPILGATPKDSLLVRKITGLNPPDITLFIGDYSRDGGTYQGRRVEKRNVVLTLDLNPNPALGETVAGLREILYKAFLDPTVDADYVKITFYDDDGRIRYLVGYAEKFEHELFDVETMSQVSIICPDPYIRDNTETVLSHPVGWSKLLYAYGGTAETGFTATIKITSPTSALTLENNGKKMIITHAFVNNDVVKITTTRGSRSLTVTPSGGSPTSLIAALEPSSPWLELHSQSNTMFVYGSTPTDLIASITEVRYTQAYWGL